MKSDILKFFGFTSTVQDKGDRLQDKADKVDTVLDKVGKVSRYVTM